MTSKLAEYLYFIQMSIVTTHNSVFNSFSQKALSCQMFHGESQKNADAKVQPLTNYILYTLKCIICASNG